MSVYSSSFQEGEYIPMLPKNRTKCMFIADVIVIQCVAVFLGSTTILICVWNPDLATMDYDKLARIMYLFDSHACEYQLKLSKAMTNLYLSNDTKGFSNILPIQWTELYTTVSSRLTVKTRLYIKLSLFFHCVWLVIAIVTRLFANKSIHLRSLKGVLSVFFYSCLSMVIFDISMALLYVSHIKQSLSKGMILRYSGWSGDLKLNSYDEFGGWLPLLASCCWLRGIIFFVLNIYCTRSLMLIRRKIRRREIKRKYENERYRAIPDARPIHFASNAMVYREGELEPRLF